MPIDDTDQFPTVVGPDETPSDAGIDATKRLPQQPISQHPLATGDVLPASEIAVPNEALRYVNETAPPVSTQMIPPAPAQTTPAQPSVPNLDEPQNVQMDAQWEIENAVGQRPLSAAQQPNLNNVAATIPVLPNDPLMNEGQVEAPPVSNKLPAVGDYVFPSVFESNVIHSPEAISSSAGAVASEPPLYGNELGNVEIASPTHHLDEPVGEQPASTNYGGPDVPRPPTIAESFESAFVRGNEAARIQSDIDDIAEPVADADAFLSQPAGVAVAASAAAARHAPNPRPRKTRKRLNTPLIKNSWLRRSAWVASGVVGLILLLVFALPFVLPNKTIAQEISRQVQSATGWALKVDGPISVGIFPTPSFRADGVAVSADGENNVLSVESLRFGINLAAVFTGEVRLSEVILIGPSIDLIVDENGRPTWQTSDTITGTGTSRTDSGLRGSSGDRLVVDDTKSALQALERLQIDEVIIRDGTVRYRDLSSAADHTVTDIDLRTALTSLDVPMQLTGGFEFQGQHFDVNSQLDEPRAAVVGARTAVDTSIEGEIIHASFGGTIDFGSGPAVGGQFAIMVPSVAKFASWLGAEIPDAAEGLESITASAELAASPSIIDVSNFALKIGEESLQGKFVADLTQEQPFISGELVSQGIDVATLLSASGLSKPGSPSVSGSMIVDIQFATVGAGIEQMTSSLNARGTLGLRSGSVTGTGLGLALGEPDADRIDGITANITINTLDTPIGLKGQATWRGEQFNMQGHLGAGQMLANGMAPAQFAINSSRVSGGVNGTVTQSGDFDGEISVETPSLRNLLAWLNQPIGDGAGLGPFSYAGELSLSPDAVHFSRAQISLDGTTGSGSGTLNFANKPVLNATLNLKRLDLTPYLASSISAVSTNSNGNLPGVAGSASADWSSANIDFSGLTSIDADLKIRADEIIWDKLHTGTVAMDVTLADGIFTADLTEMLLYEGRGAGRLQVNAAEKTPTISVNFDLASLSALPLLRDAADFSRIEGHADISIALKTRGRSELAMVSGLDGETRMIFNNGAFRGINIPRMVRTLSAKTVLGWQSNETEKTDFSEFSGSFEFNNGLARTRDIRLIGPLVRATGAGSIDLPAKTMEMRFDPKIVASLQGQGTNGSLTGLGVPIVVEGSISQPRIYPDIAGILENPEAAFEQLQKFGGGLAALTDDGGALRDKLRDQVRGRTGIDLNQIVKNGRIDKNTAVGQGADLISKLLGGGGSQTQNGGVAPRDTNGQMLQQVAGNIPVPRIDPRGSLVRQTAPTSAAPRFMTPAEARRISGGGSVAVTQPRNVAPVIPNSQPVAPTSSQGGPIDLLNPGGGGSQPVGVGSGNPTGPPTNPIKGLLRGLFGR